MVLLFDHHRTAVNVSYRLKNGLLRTALVFVHGDLVGAAAHREAERIVRSWWRTAIDWISCMDPPE